MNETRHVRLLRDGGNQTVRIPVEFELPDGEALIRRDGNRLVIEPLAKRGLSDLLASLEPLEEASAEIDDPLPAPERNL